MKNHPEDHELIRRCLDDEDRTSWEAFVRKYSRLIWNVIHKTFHNYSFTYSQEDVDDMYSSVFLSLVNNDFKKLRQFRGENSCSVSTWLSIITVRMTIDYMRKDKKHLIMESGEEDRDILDVIPDNEYRADRLLENKQRDESLKAAVDDLPARDGMIYDLIFNKGFSPEDAARTLGMTVAALYAKKHRIIKKIKKTIDTL